MSRGMRMLAAAGGLLIVGLLLVAPFWLKSYGVFVLSQWAVMTIAALGLNLTLGYAGQVSLAQASFLGIGAYTAALLTTAGHPLVLAVLLAFLLCFAIGWVLGYPALRVQHHYLAFVTLAFATLAHLVFRNEEWLTGGTYGIQNIPRPAVVDWAAPWLVELGLSRALSKPVAFYYLCLVVLALSAAAVLWIVRSPWGRAFVALRENPVRAASLGVDTRRYTLMAFAIGAGFGGIAGSMLAPLVQFIDPNPFGIGSSLSLLLMVVVGGAGYFLGPFLGALVAVLLPEWLRVAEGYYLILYAGFVMVLLAVCPGGLIGLVDRLFRARRRRDDRTAMLDLGSGPDGSALAAASERAP